MSEWLTVTPSSGVNNYNLTVSADNNQSLTGRTRYIIAYNELYGLSGYCTVNQSARSEDSISISPSSASGDYTSKQITVEVTASGNWNVISDLNVSPNNGSGDTTVTITIPENTTLDNVTYTVSFNTQDDSVSFIYNQSARVPSDYQLFYVTDNNEIMVGMNTSAEDWGAEIVSHTYNNYGIIEFDSPITTIPRRAFFRQDGYRGSGSKQYPAPTQYVLPSSVTTIGVEAFYCNTWLTKINIGNITYFGDSSFHSAPLTYTEMVFSTGLTEIRDSAFEGSSIHKPLNFKDCTSLVAIRSRAFYNSYIGNLTFPSQRVALGTYAFANFNAGYATTIYSYCSNPYSVGITVFDNYSKLNYSGTLYKAGGDYSSWITSLNSSGSGWTTRQLS